MVVIDTNVLVVSLIGKKESNREILRRCFNGTLQPYVGVALYTEYQDLLLRENIQALCRQTPVTLAVFLDDFASICKPVEVWFLWRPNLNKLMCELSTRALAREETKQQFLAAQLRGNRKRGLKLQNELDTIDQ